MNLTSILLEGQFARLEMMEEHHREPLRLAANYEEIWTFMPYKGYGNQFDAWFDRAMRATHDQSNVPFVVTDIKSQRIIGHIRYYEIVPVHKRLAIGHIWYMPEFSWKSSINTECNFLLLQYAFEELSIQRVSYYTDVKNIPTNNMITGLGAKLQAYLESHMIREDGSVRDTMYYAIIQKDWPEVKNNLQAKLK